MSAVPSLKSMSMVKVAISICNGGGLKKDIFLPSLSRNKWAGNIKPKSLTAIETLNVPKPLLDPLANQIFLVALGMRNWGLSLNVHFHLDGRYYARMLVPSMFMSNGKIDKVQVAREVATDQQLDFLKRFEIACFYSLEDSIVDFWGQMTVEQRQTFNDAGRLRNAPQRTLAVKVARELEKGGGVAFSDRVVVREVIECATAAGSEVNVRHHWSQLIPAEMEMIAEAMIGKLPIIYRSLDYRAEDSLDILCFLLPKLKEPQRWEVVLDVKCPEGFRYSCTLFDMLVSTNRIHAIWDLFSTSMKFLQGCEFIFGYALAKISHTISMSDTMCEWICCDEYHELLKKIWTLSPVHLKKYAITKNASLWTQLLFSTENTRDIFAFFLKDATREEKLDLIFSNGGEQGLICEGFRRDHGVSNFLLQLLNLSQDEKRQLLKREILLHDPLTCGSYFGSAARYCLQFEDDDTKAEYKRKLVGDRIEEICIRYIVKGNWWTKLDSLLCWYFSTADEIIRFKATLLETSGPDIRLSLCDRGQSMLACYAWFGLDPNEIRELESRALSTLPGL